MVIRGRGRYRRRITLASAMLSMFFLGAIYAYAVLLPVIMADFQWERSTAAVPQSVLLFVYAIGMGVGGAILDRTSPTGIAIAGGLAFGFGLLLASQASSLSSLVFWYGLVSGIGFGFAYVACVTAAMASFPRRRGLVAGMVVGAFGLGALLWAPLAGAFLPTLGWQGILFRFGVLVVILLPVLGIGIRSPGTLHPQTAEHATHGVSFGVAFRTRLFWIVFLAYTLVTAVGLMLLTHLVNYAIIQGIPNAALLISASAVGSGSGRIIMGWLSDRIGRFSSLIGACVLEIFLLTLLALTAHPAAVFIIAALTGFAFGTWLALYGPTATDLFGMRAAGAIYGALYLSYGIGGLLGPAGGGLLADISGGYRTTFITGVVLCAIATGFFLLAARHHPPHRPHPPTPEEQVPS